jgi:oligopeptidase B
VTGSPSGPAQPTPPQAERRPHTLSAHGDERIDEYYWLRNREDPAVIALLDAENAYTDAMTAGTAALQDSLFEEIRSHVLETDLSVPVRRGAWWHYSRTIEGQTYPVYCRRPADGNDRTPPKIEEGTPGSDPAEQVLLDVNAEAEGHDYFRIGMFDVSPDHRRLAWSADTTGGELYRVRIRDLDTGSDLDDVIEGVYYGSAWAADNTTLFYVRPDDAMRPYQVWRHEVGTPAQRDVRVFEEADERFFVSVGGTKDEQVLLISADSQVTSEWHWLPADRPTGEWRVVAPRRQGIEYAVDHRAGQFLIVTNDGAPNFRLVQAPVDQSGHEHWTDAVEPDPAVRLLSVESFRDFVVLDERAGGLTRLRLLDPASGDVRPIELTESPGTVTPIETPDPDSPLIRYIFTSLATPPTVVDYDVAHGAPTVRKQQPVPGYDRDDYVTSRTWATAADGTQVPISLFHRGDLDRSRPARCLLYGYGSYELSSDPSFAATRLPLVDRGWLFAIAHVRGGGEMGRHWYENGKLLNKRNTFTDFVACADHLTGEGWTEPGRIVARGASAGGLLMGAVVNLRPELFGGIVAGVPFVDSLTTILDPSLPLTVIEWEEWGNPVEDAAVYRYMKSYSPYDNVTAQAYPPILALGGLNDPRVSYWEPAKWVQRIRERTTGEAPTLLRTEMGAGHGGPSGRYESWRREAFVLAWLLSLPGLET